MKTLQNNFTTPEQSKRLLELGVPAWTADGYRWDFSYAFGISEDKRYSTSISVICYEYQRDLHDKLPCWSVGRLIEIYVIVRGLDISYLPIERGEDMVKYLIRLYEEKAKDMDFSKMEE